MATIIEIPHLLLPPSVLSWKSIQTHKHLRFSIKPTFLKSSKTHLSHLPHKSSHFLPLIPFASSGETVETASNGEITETDEIEISSDTQENSTGEDIEDGANDGVVEAEIKPASVLLAALQSYKQAVANDDKSSMAEIEALLLSVEDEKKSLENKLTALSQELSAAKDRVLRITADFDNFRKRNERERLSLVTKVQGEVVESLLPVLDNFERAKVQIKVETEGEEKINTSYQSIYKQFTEILGSLGVVAVETVGNPFDPLLHEAIMREDSTEYEEGIIIQEFRKGFKLGDRLLRPSMVKVSAGPGLAKPEETSQPSTMEDSGEGNQYTDSEQQDESG